jgi:hypothetical protein
MAGAIAALLGGKAKPGQSNTDTQPKTPSLSWPLSPHKRFQFERILN